jgi:hypothetical protein
MILCRQKRIVAVDTSAFDDDYKHILARFPVAITSSSLAEAKEELVLICGCQHQQQQQQQTV